MPEAVQDGPSAGYASTKTYSPPASNGLAPLMEASSPTNATTQQPVMDATEMIVATDSSLTSESAPFADGERAVEALNEVTHCSDVLEAAADLDATAELARANDEEDATVRDGETVNVATGADGARQLAEAEARAAEDAARARRLAAAAPAPVMSDRARKKSSDESTRTRVSAKVEEHESAATALEGPLDDERAAVASNFESVEDEILPASGQTQSTEPASKLSAQIVEPGNGDSDAIEMDKAEPKSRADAGVAPKKRKKLGNPRQWRQEMDLI
jgi:hypothetical protein